MAITQETVSKIKSLSKGTVDMNSLHVAYAKIPLELLKQAAQRMRETIDWYGYDYHNKHCYEAMLYVIHLVEPHFKTEFVPAT